jgi:hypothetical protein
MNRAALCTCLIAALASPATAAAGLSARGAERALRADLARPYGIHRVHATCRRKSSRSFSCS